MDRTEKLDLVHKLRKLIETGELKVLLNIEREALSVFINNEDNIVVESKKY